MFTSENVDTARLAILEDLKRRYRAGDSNVFPADPNNLHRWYQPQPNYYSGFGKMVCPICTTGALHYQRSAYNGHVKAQCTSQGCVWWME